MAVACGFHAAEREVYFSANGGSIDVSNAGLQVTHGGERLVHVPGVQRGGEAVAAELPRPAVSEGPISFTDTEGRFFRLTSSDDSKALTAIGRATVTRVNNDVADALLAGRPDIEAMFIDDLVIPEEDRVGEAGKGFTYLLDGLNPERMLIAAEALGLGRAALRRAGPPDRRRAVVPSGRATTR